MAVVHRFDPPERFVAGTVGEPGQRRFFLQARGAYGLISVACEKQQVQILAERIAQMLDDVMRTGGTREPVPALTPVGLMDSDPLETPIDEQFRAGTITLSWDPQDERVVIEVFPVPETFEDEETDAEDEAEAAYDEVLLVRLGGGLARAFANRAESVVAAGRPPCQFCGGPLDPRGHLCSRSNGYRRTPE